jgi:hypothetical protein
VQKTFASNGDDKKNFKKRFHRVSTAECLC